MQTLSVNRRLSFWTGALLIFPTAVFIMASIFKYSFGMPALFDAIWPWMENMGAKESLGWNINLLFLFGPVIALLLNFFSIVKIKLDSEKDLWQLHFSIRKYWLNIIVAATAVILLGTLLAYLVGENYRA